MRITFVILLISLMQLSAKVNSQVVRFDLKLQDVTIEKALENISKKANVEFFYNNAKVDVFKKISLDLNNVSVSEAIIRLFKGKIVKFDERNDLVVIYSVEENTDQQNNIVIVRGKVKDKNGNLLPGVSVVVKGTNKGVSTNAKGEYIIVIENKKDQILEFSFVGMRTNTVLWKGQKSIDVVMEDSVEEMDEVVVTGYQTLSKREMASSVVTVKAEDIMLDSKFSVDQMLAGTVSGLNVLQTSGEPGAAPIIRIRGTSSIIGNKAPLWVVDGIILEDPVAVDNSQLNGDDAAYLIGNAIAGINPQDIEKITVLKDASATAIYGVRAANGVIVVTTKKGKKGDVQVNYTTSMTMNMRPAYGDFYLMNAKERIELSQDIVASGLEYNRTPSKLGYEGALMDYWDKNISYEEFKNKVNSLAKMNTDWYDILFRNSFSQNHNVSLGGGSDNVSYYASLSYNDNQGTGNGSYSKRYTAMFKLNSWLNKKLFIGFKIGASNTKNNGYHWVVNPNNFAYETSRAIPAYNANGSPYNYYVGSAYSPVSYNILNEMGETGKEGKVQNVNIKIDAKYTLFDGLKYEMTAGYSMDNSDQKTYATELSTYVSQIRGYDFGTVLPNSEQELDSPIPYGGIMSISNTKQNSYTLRNSFSYNKAFEEVHVVNLMAGSEIRSVKYEGNGGEYWGWQPDRGNVFSPIYTGKYTEAIMSRAPVSITDNTSNYVSWFGTAAYTFKNKITINANVRADGSNKFGSNPKYRFLPIWSVATKYILSEEEFLKGNNVLTYLAFRGSYGIQGNVDKNSSPDLVVRVLGRDGLTKLNSSIFKYLPNPDLRWEKTKSMNYGLDYSFLNGRISGTFEYYYKKGTDMIIQKTVSQSIGRDYVKINAGNLENKGYEGSLKFFPIKKRDFEWSNDIVFGYNQNKLLSANEEEASIDDMINGNALQTGKAVGSFYSYAFAGLNHETGYPMFWGKDGEKYYELDKDNVKLVYSGNRLPKISGGFGTHFRYKNLRLDMSFNYSIGGKQRLPSIYKKEYFKIFEPTVNVTKELVNRWMKPGDEKNTIFPVLFDSDTYSELSKTAVLSLDSKRGLEMYDYCDARVAATDNIRLRSLSVSYLLPKYILDKVCVKSCRLSLQAQNLFLLSKDVWHGKDPESGNSNMPLPKVYSFGLNIGF